MSDNHEVVVDADVMPVRHGGVLHPAVAAVLNQNPTPETLRELLALQREWEAGEAKRAFTRALVNLKADLPPFIGRDVKVDFSSSKGRVSYTHTSLAHALDVVQDMLAQNGFSLTWTPSRNGGDVVVTAHLAHKDGHSEAATLSSPPDTSGTKSAAQAVASTITLLQRYTALSLLGLATADMKEDGDEGAGQEKDADSRVDSTRNMKALRAASEAGWDKEAIEEYLGGPVQKWTIADLRKLKAFLQGQTPVAGAEPPSTNPSDAATGDEAEQRTDPVVDDDGASAGPTSPEAVIIDPRKESPEDKARRTRLQDRSRACMLANGKKHQQLFHEARERLGRFSLADSRLDLLEAFVLECEEVIPR